MFTGIVEELGTVAAIEDQGDALRLTVRATTAPLWERSFDVDLVASHTFKGLSKDNVIFGVRSVDKRGNCSVVVLPTPER